MDKHVVRDGQQVALHALVERDDHLKPAHVPRIAGILQAVLVALEKELEKESAKKFDNVMYYFVFIQQYSSF